MEAQKTCLCILVWLNMYCDCYLLYAAHFVSSSLVKVQAKLRKSPSDFDQHRVSK
jgi:hypothetical protein